MKNIDILQLKSYMENMGWNQVSHYNEKIIYMESPKDDDGNVIHVPLPKDYEAIDSHILIKKAISLLAEMEEIDMEEITSKVLQKPVEVS